jgi:hypothetical protein
MWTKSSTERDEPILAKPYTDIELPRRMNARNDNELPMQAKSNTDKEDPSRDNP